MDKENLQNINSKQKLTYQMLLQRPLSGAI